MLSSSICFYLTLSLSVSLSVSLSSFPKLPPPKPNLTSPISRTSTSTKNSYSSNFNDLHRIVVQKSNARWGTGWENAPSLFGGKVAWIMHATFIYAAGQQDRPSPPSPSSHKMRSREIETDRFPLVRRFERAFFVRFLHQNTKKKREKNDGMGNCVFLSRIPVTCR